MTRRPFIVLALLLTACTKLPLQLGLDRSSQSVSVLMWGQSNATDPALATFVCKNITEMTGRPCVVNICAHSATSSTQWATNYNGMLDELRSSVAQYKPDVICALQGEGDGDKTAPEYAANLRVIIAAARAVGKDSMLWSEALCHFQGYDYADVRGGQQMLWHDAGVIPGPDADSLRLPGLTHDSGLHFNIDGNAQLGKAWAKVLASYLH